MKRDANRIVLGSAVDGGADVELDVARLVETRLLVTANSGAGKSWTLRRLIELTHVLVPVIVIDPDGEFHTLRDRFDFVLVGRGGDCAAEVRSAALLARRLVELRASAVIDLSELRPADRIAFVRVFFTALIELPRELWASTMVVLDEAHKFSPEKGHGEAASADAVIDVATRGRKRGLCLVAATQRIAKLAKDVAAECGNVLVGRTTLDIDVKRAADALGIVAGERAALKSLRDGTFYAQGPAISDRGVLVQIGDVVTRHPKAGQAVAAPAAPRDKVRAILARLADIPAEAEAEARTNDDLRARVRDLERQLKAKPHTNVDDQRVAALVDSHVRDERRRADGEHRAATKTLLAEVEAACVAAIRGVCSAAVTGHATLERVATARGVEWKPSTAERSIAPRARAVTVELPRSVGAPRKVTTDGVTAPMQRLLDAIAWWNAAGVEQPGLAAVALAARYRPTSSGFRNLRSQCKQAGLIEYPGDGVTVLTPDGDRVASHPPSPPSDDAALAMAIEVLDAPAGRVLTALVERGGEATHDELAAATDYSPTSSGFRNLKSRLHVLDLVEYPSAGRVRAAAILYPERAR